ncbi:MAG TPA: HAD hydrolase family protein [Pyrinomonadaceae bacterium]|nr:HAD hydrolase family protein [Pyrinomonadaceae bacterium]
MDCDGVLTDGRLYFSETGEALKVFDVRDGYGLTLWHKAGFRSGIISGRKSPIVEKRARDLGIEFVWQGREDKAAALDELLAASNVSTDEIAFIADDTIDLPLFPKVGLTVAVADAHKEVPARAHYTTKANGGHGAVRELIDLLLDAKKK